jgi:apolipoprotein N-acyltransferase
LNSKGKKNLFLLLAAFISTAFMLTLIQPPFSISLLAWLAYVPFILACSPDAKLKSLLLISYLASLGYWLANLYWLVPVTIAGWLAFCLYTAILWPLMVIAFRYLRTKKLPLFITAPIIIVAAERLQGFFLGGFFWRHLSHSQFQNLSLIQIADVFGAAGVSFLIAMFNGLIADLIIPAGKEKWLTARKLINSAIVVFSLALTITYGQFRINQTARFAEQGPLVAAVQSNVPQFVKESLQASEQIFDDLISDSNEALAAGARLVIWPETMVMTPLNKEFLDLCSDLSEPKVFHQRLCNHSKQKAYILVGAYSTIVELKGTDYLAREKYNSAFLYTPEGAQDKIRYDKIHLVAFGEYVPFKKTVPFIYKILMKFTPYDYDYSLDAGNRFSIFETGGGTEGSKKHKFSVMICYEDTIPYIARRFTLDKSANKKIDWLVNISNDGWFVRFKTGTVIPSAELAQHTAVCAFRAVENRTAIVRSVNTGISCLIDTTGGIRNGFKAGSLPKKAPDRKAVSGWFAEPVPIDKRVTFFSRFGQWLDDCCAIAFVCVVFLQLRLLIFRNKKIGSHS